ncbi:MAG: D-tyrosyl-tRNA(Tyr) deacylase [Limnobacter sp.]|nr:D-tyrosyl-tRNA(Tyr) deacylase [Limnobacter sp.]
MLALVQRVGEASVRVGGELIGEIGQGLLVFVCAERGDTDDDAARLLQRVLRLRCFGDEAGRMNRSVQDVGGGLLVVSQFTLAADTSSGNRPGFSLAAAPDEARRLYELFVAGARAAHPRVATGVFGADMKVALVNDGPVTLWLRTGASTSGSGTSSDDARGCTGASAPPP